MSVNRDGLKPNAKETGKKMKRRNAAFLFAPNLIAKSSCSQNFIFIDLNAYLPSL